MQRFRNKAPGDRLDHAFTMVLATGDSLTGSPTVTASPATLTIEAPTIVAGQVVSWISGGVVNTQYELTATAATALGRVVVVKAALHVGATGLDDSALIGSALVGGAG